MPATTEQRRASTGSTTAGSGLTSAIGSADDDADDHHPGEDDPRAEHPARARGAEGGGGPQHGGAEAADDRGHARSLRGCACRPSPGADRRRRRPVLPSAFAPGARPVPRAVDHPITTEVRLPWPRRPAPGRAPARRRDSSASVRPQRRHEVLQPRRSAAKTYVAKALRAAAAPAESTVEPTVALAEALSALDRAAKAGAIHPNAAARRKSRLTRKVNAALGGAQVQTARPRHEDDRQGRGAEGRQGPHRRRQGRQGQGRPDRRRQGPRRAEQDRPRRGRRRQGRRSRRRPTPRPRPAAPKATDREDGHEGRAEEDRRRPRRPTAAPRRHRQGHGQGRAEGRRRPPPRSSSRGPPPDADDAPVTDRGVRMSAAVGGRSRRQAGRRRGSPADSLVGFGRKTPYRTAADRGRRPSSGRRPSRPSRTARASRTPVNESASVTPAAASSGPRPSSR